MDSLSDSDKHRFVLAPLFPSSVHVHLYVHCSCVFICALFMCIRMCTFPSVGLHTCAHVCSPERVEAQGWCWDHPMFLFYFVHGGEISLSTLRLVLPASSFWGPCLRQGDMPSWQ